MFIVTFTCWFCFNVLDFVVQSSPAISLVRFLFQVLDKKILCPIDRIPYIRIGEERVQFHCGEVIATFMTCPGSQLFVFRACPKALLEHLSGRRIKRTN